MIEKYDFGDLIFNGKSYSSDLIILPDNTISSWWREDGHYLQLKDLEDVKEEDFELLIIGQGYSSCMAIAKEVFDYFQSINREVWNGSTIEACKVYNENCEKKKVVAGLHLTC